MNKCCGSRKELRSDIMTPMISLPSGGLSLSDFPTDLNKRGNKLDQSIEIFSIGDESVEQIVSSISNGVEAIVSLGNKPVCFI